MIYTISASIILAIIGAIVSFMSCNVPAMLWAIIAGLNATIALIVKMHN